MQFATKIEAAATSAAAQTAKKNESHRSIEIVQCRKDDCLQIRLVKQALAFCS